MSDGNLVAGEVHCGFLGQGGGEGVGAGKALCVWGRGGGLGGGERGRLSVCSTKHAPFVHSEQHMTRRICVPG
jgi:hypothetical protein